MYIAKIIFKQFIIKLMAIILIFSFFTSDSLAQSSQEIETIRLNLITSNDFTVLESFIAKFLDKGTSLKFGLDVTLCGGSIYYSDDDKPPIDREPYEMRISCSNDNNLMSCGISKLVYMVDETNEQFIGGGIEYYLTGPFKASIYNDNGQYTNTNQNPFNNCNRVTGYFTNIESGGVHQGVISYGLEAIPGN
jgi:hypothetical protein